MIVAPDVASEREAPKEALPRLSNRGPGAALRARPVADALAPTQEAPIRPSARRQDAPDLRPFALQAPPVAMRRAAPYGQPVSQSGLRRAGLLHRDGGLSAPPARRREPPNVGAGHLAGLTIDDMRVLLGTAGPQPPVSGKQGAGGLTPAQLARLPCWSLGDKVRDGDDNECIMCFECYEPHSRLKTLPCMHVFHANCIDKWLSCGRPGCCECPICHTKVDV